MKKLSFIAVALAAMTFVGCSSDDGMEQPVNSQRPTLTFVSYVATRSTNTALQKTQIAEGVKVGVFVKNASGFISGGNNAQLTANGAGAFTGTPVYFPEDGSAVSVQAYAPYSSNWNDMADVVDRVCPDDFGIRRALTVIGFRYAGEAIGRGALENAQLHTMMSAMFRRMDREAILSLDNVSPQLRRLAFELAGRDVPRISGLGYARGLVEEFAYSIRTNGPDFAVVRTGVYLERRKRQDKRSQAYVDARN